MCFDEGKLLAYLDGEVTAEERTEIETHVRSCTACTDTLASLEADRVIAGGALARLRADAEAAPAGASRPAVERRRALWGRYAAAAAAVLFVGSFAFAPVRGAAAELLRVFRVQNVQTISFSQADIEQMGKALESGKGHIDLRQMGEVWVDGGSMEPKDVTLAEAQKAVDFPVRLPEGAGSPKLRLQGGQTYKFKLHVDAINEALRYYGSSKTFPASLEGKVFTVKSSPILLASYGDESKPNDPKDPDDVAIADAGALFAGQGRSPELVVPDGVDPLALRDVLVNLPFLPESVRSQLASVDDWQHTLLIPDFGGTARDIKIGDVPAVVMSPDGPARSARRNAGGGDIAEHVTTIVWNEDGVVRALGGPIDEAKAIALAKSCMK